MSAPRTSGRDGTAADGESASPPVKASRSLVLPGPQPPLSHFGATLLRHVLATGLRYSLYTLGLPMPQVPPIRIVHLRVYFDRGPLEELLGEAPAGGDVVAAILEPGGRPEGPHGKGAGGFDRVRGAELFHRLRYATGGRKRRPGREIPRVADASWDAVRNRLRAALPVLNDVLLAEIVGSLRRRRRRRRRTVEPCWSREAARFSAGRARLDHLGPADPLAPCWTTETAPPPPDPPTGAADRLRGGFREAYRAALNPLRLAYLELADSAVERGLIEQSEDAFFLPVDLAEDLAGERKPRWLGPALAANRREYESLLGMAEPPEALYAAAAPELEPLDRQDAWALGPLAPLE